MYKDKRTMKKSKMPMDLQNLYDNMSTFQKKYCEYRAKGLTQGDAAKRAGSNATGTSLNRVGYNTEQEEGSKALISWHLEQRAKTVLLDDIEILDKLREVYKEALEANKFSDANKAIELMGTMIGIFGNTKAARGSDAHQKNQKSTKNNTSAFREEDADNETEDRIKKLREMMKEVNE